MTFSRDDAIMTKNFHMLKHNNATKLNQESQRDTISITSVNAY